MTNRMTEVGTQAELFDQQFEDEPPDKKSDASAGPDKESEVADPSDKESELNSALSDVKPEMQTPSRKQRLTAYCKEHGLTDDQRRKGAYLVDHNPIPTIVKMNVAKPWEDEGICSSTWYRRNRPGIPGQVKGLRALFNQRNYAEIENVRARIQEWEIIRHHFCPSNEHYRLDELIARLNEVVEEMALDGQPD